MSWGAISVEWYIMDKKLRLREDSDERILEQIDDYLDNNIKLTLLLEEVKDRPELYKLLLEERPELWV